MSWVCDMSVYMLPWPFIELIASYRQYRFISIENYAVALDLRLASST
jgi:hypothetical protein